MRAIRFLAGAVLGLWSVVVLFVGFLFGGLACDESCDPATGNWTDDPNAFQWDAIQASGLVAAIAGVLTAMLLIAGRRRGAFVGWAVASLAGGALAALWVAAYGIETSGVLLILAGPVAGLVAVRA